MLVNLEDGDIENLEGLKVSDDLLKSPSSSNMRTRSVKVCRDQSRLLRSSQKVLTEVQDSIKQNTTSNDSVNTYFMREGKRWGQGKTSNSTLSNLSSQSGLVDPLTLEKLMKQHRHASEPVLRSMRKRLSARLFPRWPFYLREGFNILAYGAGSKRDLLESFRKDYLEKVHCVVVPGYNPSVTVKQILHSIYHDWLQIPVEQSRKPQDQMRQIAKLMSRPGASESPLYLIIHNIDGPGMRNAKAQAILARLASTPNVHVIASVDHINIPVLWSHDELSRFSWIWEDCTTLDDYTMEANYSNSSLLQHLLAGVTDHGTLGTGSNSTILASLRQVAASLTQNARDIFRMIAEYQLDTPVSDVRGTNVGMPLEHLYWRCRDAFLATNEATLRAQLTEFRDHKLLKMKKAPDGTETLIIPIDRANLQKLVQNFDFFC